MSVVRRWLRTGALPCVLVTGWAGCAGGAPVPEHSGAAQASPAGLTGEWLQYWSVAGEAASQRYTFLDSGEFRWAAAPSVSPPTAGTPLRKLGSFEVLSTERGRSLVLHVTSTDLAGCDSACDADEGRAFHVEHTPALEEEIALGECAPNAEAERIDAGYTCVALADEAFWRRP